MPDPQSLEAILKGIREVFYENPNESLFSDTQIARFIADYDQNVWQPSQQGTVGRIIESESVEPRVLPDLETEKEARALALRVIRSATKEIEHQP